MPLLFCLCYVSYCLTLLSLLSFSGHVLLSFVNHKASATNNDMHVCSESIGQPYVSLFILIRHFFKVLKYMYSYRFISNKYMYDRNALSGKITSKLKVAQCRRNTTFSISIARFLLFIKLSKYKTVTS